jgi:type IV pilus assembly protein PilC
VADEVDGGMKLSQALSHYPNVFSNFFVAMIKSGETSGRLDDVLEYLATQQEKDYDLISKIKGAMIYPAFIMCGLVAVGIVMMVVVIPKLTAILQETGGKLPMSTKILIGTSSFMTHYWWLLIIILAALFFIFKYLTKTPTGKRYLDWLAIKLPVFGKLFQRIYLVRFARSLATLSSGGIPLVESLKITSEIVGNRVYCDIIDRTVKEVEDGNPIASVFIETKEIPAMVSYMVSVGEQTGKLDVVLEKLADFYSREIDNLVANLVSMIEPMIMVVMGVAVGLMVAAIIMPMYNLASSF